MNLTIQGMSLSAFVTQPTTATAEHVDWRPKEALPWENSDQVSRSWELLRLSSQPCWTNIREGLTRSWKQSGVLQERCLPRPQTLPCTFGSLFSHLHPSSMFAHLRIEWRQVYKGYNKRRSAQGFEGLHGCTNGRRPGKTKILLQWTNWGEGCPAGFVYMVVLGVAVHWKWNWTDLFSNQAGIQFTRVCSSFEDTRRTFCQSFVLHVRRIFARFWVWNNTVHLDVWNVMRNFQHKDLHIVNQTLQCCEQITLYRPAVIYLFDE